MSEEEQRVQFRRWMQKFRRLSNPARKLQREINDKKKLQIQEERPKAFCGQLLGPGFVKEGQVGQVEEDLSISALFKSCKSF